MPLDICDTIEGVDRLEQESIKGKKLCGWRGGKSFKDVIRPDYVTGECKPGYVPCNPMNDRFDRMKYIESTICVEVDKTYDCPITGISFGEPYHLASPRHTYQKLTDDKPGEVYHPFDDIYFTKSNY